WLRVSPLRNRDLLLSGVSDPVRLPLGGSICRFLPANARTGGAHFPDPDRALPALPGTLEIFHLSRLCGHRRRSRLGDGPGDGDGLAEDGRGIFALPPLRSDDFLSALPRVGDRRQGNRPPLQRVADRENSR